MAGPAIMTDSGFWIALYDATDQYHEEALTLPIDLDEISLVVPWPCLYESLSTRLARRKEKLSLLMTGLRRPNVQLLSDLPYRDVALENMTRIGTQPTRPFSLVDNVLRAALTDPNVNVSGLITFNPNDFRDVCGRRGIALLPR
jgi:predicted nucleic acid-binding protein